MADSFNLTSIHWAGLTLAEFPLPQHIFHSHHAICYWNESYYLLVSTSGMQAWLKIPLRGGRCAAGEVLWNKIPQGILRHKGRNTEMPSEFFHTSMRTKLAMQPVSPKEENLFFWTSFKILFSITVGSYESLDIDSVRGEAETSRCSTCLLQPWISRLWTPWCSALETFPGCQKVIGLSILWAGLFAISKLLWTL